MMRWAVAFDKLKFWKKDDDFGLGSDDFMDSHPSGLPDTGNQQDADPFSHPDFSNTQSQNYPEPAPFPGQQSAQSHDSSQYEIQHEDAISHRDIELILAKLDMIKSELDSVHQRIRKIEQSTETQQQQKRYW